MSSFPKRTCPYCGESVVLLPTHLRNHCTELPATDPAFSEESTR